MSISSAKKYSRGRPRIDSEAVNVRFERLSLIALDTWIARQPDPKPGRPEAIRRLVEKSLDIKRVNERQSSQQSNTSLDRQIAEQKVAIAEMPEHSEPSPEAGMAAMDKAVAENDLIDMKNKRTRQRNAKLR